MRAEDLRIGNYYEDDMERVGKLLKWVSSKKVELKMEFSKLLIDFDCLEPIPLTEEWLVKFGFKKPAHSWVGDKFHLTEWDDSPLNWCVSLNKNNGVLVLKLKHVHQLQNLYHALCGSELILKE